MKSIHQFLDKFLEAETKTQVVFRKPDILAYNTALKNLYEFAGVSGVGFGMAFIKTLRPARFYENMQKKPAPHQRMIFKISRYKHDIYQDLYACYLSLVNPGNNNYKAYEVCCFVGQVEGELKIVAQHSFDVLKSKWFFTGGDETLKFASISKPVDIERLIEPTEKGSLADYQKNK